jgi:hypothetical protein
MVENSGLAAEQADTSVVDNALEYLISISRGTGHNDSLSPSEELEKISHNVKLVGEHADLIRTGGSKNSIWFIRDAVRETLGDIDHIIEHRRLYERDYDVEIGFDYQMDSEPLHEHVAREFLDSIDGEIVGSIRSYWAPSLTDPDWDRR